VVKQTKLKQGSKQGSLLKLIPNMLLLRHTATWLAPVVGVHAACDVAGLLPLQASISCFVL
jgi:hypothetical protein